MNTIAVREILKAFLFSRVLIYVILSVTVLTQFTTTYVPHPLHHPTTTIDFTGLTGHLNRVLSTADSSWYISIAEHGYAKREFDASRQENWAFFPLFPVLLRALFPLTHSHVVSGVLVGNFCFFAALYVLWNFANLAGYDDPSKVKAIWLLALFPTSYFFAAPFTESLFLLLVLLCFYFVATKQYLGAAVMLSLATAARPTGMFLLPAFFVALWQAHVLFSVTGVLALCIAPLGILLYCAYLYLICGDPLAFIHIQVTWARGTGNFFERFLAILPQLALPVADWNFVWLNVACVGIGVYAAYHLARERKFSLALVVLVPFLGALYSCSFQSISRFTITLFPIFLVLGNRISPSVERMLLATFAALLGILVMLYGLHVTSAMT